MGCVLGENLREIWERGDFVRKGKTEGVHNFVSDLTKS
jgi:hypothetical protein